jgi:hypothetical protein
MRTMQIADEIVHFIVEHLRAATQMCCLEILLSSLSQQQLFGDIVLTLSSRARQGAGLMSLRQLNITTQI